MTATNSFAELMKEHFAFQKEQVQKRHQRIVAVARGNPELPLWALAERFGMTCQNTARVLIAAGVEYEVNELLWVNTRRRRSA